MTTAAAPRQDLIPLGIFYMIGSTLLFAGVNAAMKWEVAIYPVGEVAFYRALFALVAVTAIILPRSGIAVFRTRRYLAHLQRGVSQFGSMTCMFVAFSLMSLGSAVAISFAAPPSAAATPRKTRTSSSPIPCQRDFTSGMCFCW